MTDNRISRLEKLGFEWVLSGGRNHHHLTTKEPKMSDSANDTELESASNVIMKLLYRVV